MMRLSRRALLSTAPALVLPRTLTAADAPQVSTRADWFLSAGADPGLTHHVAAIDGTGRTQFAHPLPDRGHAVAVSPDRTMAVICARRAGRFVSVIDMTTMSIVHQIDAPIDRHFYGHGVFSPDGARLFVTENAFDVGEGRIGVYDAADGFSRLGEWPSHGIGPHELILHPDGSTLVVANGGILTHPDTGRQPLNLDTMAPNLAFIDTGAGDLIGRIEMPQTLRLLSGRHLAISQGGIVAIVMQYQGDDGGLPPLVAISRNGAPLSFRSAPGPIQAGMANYCGSVAFDRDGTSFGVSSPRGDMFTFWSSEGGFLTSVSITDGCGIASGRSAGTFILSSGTGGLWRFDLLNGHLQRLAGPIAPIAHWDNHLTAL